MTAQESTEQAGQQFIVDLTDNTALEPKSRLVKESLLPTGQIFQQGNQEVWVERINGKLTVRPLTKELLKFIASYTCTWTKRKSNLLVEVHPDDETIAAALVRRDINLPRLRGISTTPIITPSGAIIDKPGYNAESEVFCDIPQELQGLNVPLAPTEKDVQEAVQILQKPFQDFPLDDAARAGIIACILTVTLRALIAGVVPMWAYLAATPGTGKSLMLRCVAIIATGDEPAILTEVNNPEEFQKTMASLLAGSPAIIVIDNLNKLDSGTLAAMLTSKRIQFRQLGTQKMLEYDVYVVMAITGNNIELTQELARRTISVEQIADVERPWTRTGFAIPNLVEYVKENRSALVRSILTLARNWFVKGKPSVSTKLLGSYEEWHRTIGGIMEAAGIKGLLQDAGRLYERADMETMRLEAFILAWHQEHQSRIVRANELVDFAIRCEVVEEMRTTNGSVRSLGKLLAKIENRVLKGYRVTRGGIIGGILHWKLAAIQKQQNDEQVGYKPLVGISPRVLVKNDSIENSKEQTHFTTVTHQPATELPDSNPWGGIF
jgi:putative DNA primase/helicase